MSEATREERFYASYERISNRMMPVVIIVFLLATGFLAYQYTTTGELFTRDISLAGGVSLSFQTTESVDPDALEMDVMERLHASSSVRIVGAGAEREVIVESTAQDTEKINALIDHLAATYNVPEGEIAQSFIGETLGAAFYRETIIALIIAFAFMAVVVMIIFRKALPAAYIIFAAAANIIETVFIVNLLGIPISTGGLAAFLMLLGYSVDTDILLTTKVLRSRAVALGSRVLAAFRTGMTMSLTSLAAVTVAYLITNSPLIEEIMLIIGIGLIFDMFNTWLFNAPILTRYVRGLEARGR